LSYINKKGFTMMEALIAIGIMTIALLGIIASQVYFGSQTSDQSLKDCLVGAASTYLSQSVNNLTPDTTFTCPGGFSGTLASNTYAESSRCNRIEVTATSGGKSVTLSTKKCSF